MNAWWPVCHVPSVPPVQFNCVWMFVDRFQDCLLPNLLWLCWLYSHLITWFQNVHVFCVSVVSFLSSLIYSQSLSRVYHFWCQQIGVYWDSGRSVCVLLLNSLWAGLAFRPCDRVFLWSNVIRYGSRPDILALCIRRFAVLTADFAFPLLCWWVGDDALCWNSQLYWTVGILLTYIVAHYLRTQCQVCLAWQNGLSAC